MGAFVRTKDRGSPRVVPMLVMGEIQDGEYVLKEMLKSSSALVYMSRDDFIIEESVMTLDPGGMLIMGPGYEMFSFQGDIFRVHRTKLDYAALAFRSLNLKERVPEYLRVGMYGFHVYIPVCVRDDLVRRLLRLGEEFGDDEMIAQGDHSATEAPVHTDCGDRFTRVSRVIGPPKWICNTCTPDEIKEFLSGA